MKYQIIGVFWALLSATFATHLLAQPGPADEYFPSKLNYWNCANALIVDPGLQAGLEVSPVQLRQLKSILSDDKFEALLHAELKGDIGATDQQVDAAWASLDKVVYAELAKALHEEQLKVLRPTVMRSKYRAGYSPFLDVELLRHAGVPTAQILRLREDVKKAKLQHTKRLAEICGQTARVALADLSVDAKKRFAGYCGNTFLPDFDVPNDLDYESIPFPRYAKTLGSLPHLLESEEVQKQLGISAEQLNRLRDIKTQHSRCLDEFDSRSGKRFPEHFREVTDASFVEMKAVLSKQQLLQLAQEIARLEFIGDFTGPFSQPEVVEYLGLTGDEAERALEKCRDAKKELVKEIAKLNQTIFLDVANTLNTDSGEKLEAIFREVWKDRS